MLKLAKGNSLGSLSMHTITLTIPDETLQALQTTPDKLSQEMLMVIAVKLYELGRLSSGAAANLANIPRTVFLTKLADYGVNTFCLTEAELTEDLVNA
jgi:predicted HTH domain antitoxin